MDKTLEILTFIAFAYLIIPLLIIIAIYLMRYTNWTS